MGVFHQLCQTSQQRNSILFKQTGSEAEKMFRCGGKGNAADGRFSSALPRSSGYDRQHLHFFSLTGQQAVLEG